jgi:hypothetical protein
MMTRFGNVSVIGRPTPIGASVRAKSVVVPSEIDAVSAEQKPTKSLNNEHANALRHRKEDQIIIPPKLCARHEPGK